MGTDRLTEIFHQMLAQTNHRAETAAELIRRAAGVYAIELLMQGEIPYAFRQDVLADLEAELLVLYRKVTYGYLSLQAYRETLPRKRTRKAAP